MTISILLMIALSGTLLGILTGKLAPRLWLACNVVGLLAGAVAAGITLSSGQIWEWHSVLRIGGEQIHLRLDGLSAYFAMLVCVAGGAISVYSLEYWSDAERPRSAKAGRCWWSALLLCMLLVVTCANGLHFLLVW